MKLIDWCIRFLVAGGLIGFLIGLFTIIDLMLIR